EDRRRRRRRGNIATAQIRITGLLPPMDQKIEFEVQIQWRMRSNVAARRNTDRHVEIIIRSVSGNAGRAIRQMTEADARIGRPSPSLTDQVLAGEGAGFQIPVLVAGLAAR